MSTDTRLPSAKPWWKYGHVWLLISGPAVVVVASFVTGWLALRHIDPVVDADYYRHGLEINRTLAAQATQEQQKTSLAPALQARNHAATPVQDIPVPRP
ncbi:MAG TPA: FixH family protein [Burkholderiaceae bacterium]